jgi:hypothetical protein
MGSRQDTTLTGLSKKRNLSKETHRITRRQQQHRHRRRPVMSRGSRQDTTLTGLSRQGALWKEMDNNKERKLAHQTSRKQERTHNITNCQERMRENYPTRQR